MILHEKLIMQIYFLMINMQHTEPHQIQENTFLGTINVLSL